MSTLHLSYASLAHAAQHGAYALAVADVPAFATAAQLQHLTEGDRCTLCVTTLRTILDCSCPAERVVRSLGLFPERSTFATALVLHKESCRHCSGLTVCPSRSVIARIAAHGPRDSMLRASPELRSHFLEEHCADCQQVLREVWEKLHQLPRGSELAEASATANTTYGTAIKEWYALRS